MVICSSPSVLFHPPSQRLALVSPAPRTTPYPLSFLQILPPPTCFLSLTRVFSPFISLTTTSFFSSQALSHQEHREVTRLENSYVFLRKIKAPHPLTHLGKKLFKPWLPVCKLQTPADAWRRKRGPSLHGLVMRTWCRNSPAALQKIRPGL